jgi:hypothetical protein
MNHRARFNAISKCIVAKLRFCYHAFRSNSFQPHLLSREILLVNSLRLNHSESIRVSRGASSGGGGSIEIAQRSRKGSNSGTQAATTGSESRSHHVKRHRSEASKNRTRSHLSSARTDMRDSPAVRASLTAFRAHRPERWIEPYSIAALGEIDTCRMSIASSAVTFSDSSSLKIHGEKH